MLTTSLFFAAAIVIAVNILYYFSFISLLRWRSCANKSNLPVSVIVCAKNEQDNLKRLLPLLLEQDYPDYEIIAINDGSRDATLDVIQEFAEQDSRIQLVDVVPNESFWGNKKYALTLGIRKAKNEHLLFIDADCVPASTDWISGMTSQFNDRRKIVLGYGGYENCSGILNAIIRFETAITATQYLNYALKGSPYMGVGRNLAYESQLFYSVRGFQNHLHILGGDDDLFINQVATASNVAVEINPDSFTYSQPKTSWSAWWNQKRRHVNTASHYKFTDKFLLGLFHFSQVGFYASLFLLPFLDTYLWWLVGLIGARMLTVWLILGMNFSRLKEKNLIAFTPILEIVLLFIQIGLLFHNLNSKPAKW